MAGRKNGLGRGLDALFPDKKTASKENEVKHLLSKNLPERQ